MKKKLPNDICQHYSPDRGSVCPVCGKSTLPGVEVCSYFHVSPYDQVLVGYADAPWPHGEDVAAVFECPNCFEKYWFHLALFLFSDFEECQQDHKEQKRFKK